MLHHDVAVQEDFHIERRKLIAGKAAEPCADAVFAVFFNEKRFQIP